MERKCEIIFLNTGLESIQHNTMAIDHQQENPNRPVSQMQATLVACHQLVLNYSTLPKLLYGFEHKM